MICDMSDVTMRQDDEEEKIPTHSAPTPSAAHNPKCKTTGDGHEFQATKSDTMSKTSKTKETFDIKKMSKTANVPKNVTNVWNTDNSTNLTEDLTTSLEKVAVTEMSQKCDKMLTLPKVMAFTDTAVSTHSVSEMRQINMAGNI